MKMKSRPGLHGFPAGQKIAVCYNELALGASLFTNNTSLIWSGVWIRLLTDVLVPVSVNSFQVYCESVLSFTVTLRCYWLFTPVSHFPDVFTSLISDVFIKCPVFPSSFVTEPVMVVFCWFPHLLSSVIANLSLVSWMKFIFFTFCSFVVDSVLPI